MSACKVILSPNSAATTWSVPSGEGFRPCEHTKVAALSKQAIFLSAAGGAVADIPVPPGESALAVGVTAAPGPAASGDDWAGGPVRGSETGPEDARDADALAAAARGVTGGGVVSAATLEAPAPPPAAPAEEKAGWSDLRR